MLKLTVSNLNLFIEICPVFWRLTANLGPDLQNERVGAAACVLLTAEQGLRAERWGLEPLRQLEMLPKTSGTEQPALIS